MRYDELGEIEDKERNFGMKSYNRLINLFGMGSRGFPRIEFVNNKKFNKKYTGRKDL